MVLGVYVPLILPISEEIRLGESTFSHIVEILLYLDASAPVWRSGDNISTPNITTHALE